MKIRVWQYDVAEDDVDSFESAYGPAGSWAELFSRSEGFRGTELFVAASVPTRWTLAGLP